MSGSVRRLSETVARLVPLSVLLFATACSSVPRVDALRTAYVAEVPSGEMELLERYAPIFVLQTADKAYNRIGTPVAHKDHRGRVRVSVGPCRATYYARADEFATERGTYTNLVYRVHFERVPALHLTQGRNVGLFVSVTLDEEQRPVLVTSLHTCGCYLAITPTTYLPRDAWPREWGPAPRDVHGEVLPGLLNYPKEFDDAYRPVIFVRDATHRVTDVRVMNVDEVDWRYQVMRADVQPMAALQRLQVNGSTTSFFYESGRRKGYVKGSRKPLEMLTMGWWALDLWVGRDKALGDPEETGVTLYTSLKPWARKKSDFGRFPQLLDYWGWRL